MHAVKVKMTNWSVSETFCEGCDQEQYVHRASGKDATSKKYIPKAFSYSLSDGS